MLFPGQANEHPQVVNRGDIEQPAGRNGVDPHRVDAVRRHGGEVLLDRIPAVLNPRLVGTECSVGNALEPELF